MTKRSPTLASMSLGGSNFIGFFSAGVSMSPDWQQCPTTT
jgi:hypothetical protein